MLKRVSHEPVLLNKRFFGYELGFNELVDTLRFFPFCIFCIAFFAFQICRLYENRAKPGKSKNRGPLYYIPCQMWFNPYFPSNI